MADRKGFTCALLIAVVVQLSGCGDGETAAAPVSEGKAACPPTRDTGWQPGVPSRSGEFVPADPKAARLCVYPLPGTGTTAPLSRTIDAADPARVTGYLNGLPEQAPAGYECLLGGRTQYTVVLEYTGGHATVSVGCGIEYAGAVRPEFDLKKLLALWDAVLES